MYKNKDLVYPNLIGFPSYMSLAKENTGKSLIGFVKIVHRDKNDKVLWDNAAALINLGEEAILKSWFQNVANYTPSSFKLNLATDVTIAESGTTYTVVTGTGYAEHTIARNETDWTASLNTDDWQVLSKNCIFTASGSDWTTAKKLVIEAVLNSVDVLIGYGDLSEDRTIGDGESLTTSITLKLS